ncbi:MAG: flagellar basal body protein [Candidatus Melainabacteria bacterium]|nr:flagellar basal body protein [Candidatus Melainabacteria bacterium]
MSLMDAFKISEQGMDTQSARLNVHAVNIANVHTPGYVRKIPVLSETNAQSFEEILSKIRNQGVIQGGLAYRPAGVEMSGVLHDSTPAKKIYRPGHPYADKDGYVTLSNTNILGDMADAMVSSRMYEAQLSVFGITKAMANRAIELGRGQ